MTHAAPTRHAMTAIEIVVVLSIAMTLVGMVVPSTLTSLRHNAVRSGASSILDVWTQVQMRAQTEMANPSDPTPDHYGVVLVQENGRAWVAMIHDDRDSAALSGSPEQARMYLDAGRFSADSSKPAALRHELDGSVVVATADASGTWSVRDGVWVWYARFGSATPISSGDVANSAANRAAPFGIGVTEPPEIAATSGVSAPVLCHGLRVQTHDYTGTQGHAVAVSIYHAGVGVIEDQQ
jgi:hypothetical protein